MASPFIFLKSMFPDCVIENAKAVKERIYNGVELAISGVLIKN